MEKNAEDLQVFSIEMLRAQPETPGSGGSMPGDKNPLDYAPPIEPVFKDVQYLKLDEPRNMTERADRLMNGIMVDVVPEYDHYGYEIRKYMAHISGPEVLGNRERLLQEIKNIRKSKIVLKYWREATEKEIAEIQKFIEENQEVDARLRTLFKYNTGIVRSFFIDAEGWLDANEKLLTFLTTKEIDKEYQYKDPYIEFRNKGDRAEFISLFKAREEYLGYIHKYSPFKVMIY